MKIKVIKNFLDRTENLKLRKIGDELDVPNDRAKFLINKEYAIEVTTTKKK